MITNDSEMLAHCDICEKPLRIKLNPLNYKTV